MTIIELEHAAAALGLAVVPLDIYEGMQEQVLEAEELRCDLELLSGTLVDDAITAGLGTR